MSNFTTAGWIVLGILLIVVLPFLTIWALNTLFPVLAIPYTWQTWFAVNIVKGIFTISYSSKK